MKLTLDNESPSLPPGRLGSPGQVKVLGEQILIMGIQTLT